MAFYTCPPDPPLTFGSVYIFASRLYINTAVIAARVLPIIGNSTFLMEQVEKIRGFETLSMEQWVTSRSEFDIARFLSATRTDSDGLGPFDPSQKIWNFPSRSYLPNLEGV